MPGLHSPPPYRVLVIGAYGFFGSRLTKLLYQNASSHLIVAGRNAAAAQALVEQLQASTPALSAHASLQSAALDLNAPDFATQLAALAPQVVVHTAGPFQGQDYQVARACITQACHYIDLADGREFVAGIGALDPQARAANVLITSGASSVPALSSAVADHLAQGFSEVHDIDIGISPGNRTERGLSTVASVLSYCGKAIPGPAGQPAIGWRGTWRHHYGGPVGARLLSPCDVPDLSILASHYPGNPRVRFGAGQELGLLHRGMNCLAVLVQLGLIRNAARYARPLKYLSDWFKHWGSDAGAMHLSLSGRDNKGQPVTRTWELLATAGDGPYVPTLAAAALVRKLSQHQLPVTGAQPCLGLLSLDDFVQQAQGLNISFKTSTQSQQSPTPA